MGNKPPQRLTGQKQQERNENEIEDSNFSTINLQLQSAIKELENNGVDCHQFKKGFVKFDRGQNFEGLLGQNGQVVGLARYYTNTDRQNSVFYGKIRQGKYWGPGVLLKIRKGGVRNSIRLSVSNIITNQEEQLSVTYLSDWSASQSSKGMMKICQGDKEILFEGDFRIDQNFDGQKQPTYEEGKLIIKEDGVTTLLYDGKFRNNNFDDDNGRLQIIGKVIYQGQFKNNTRHGFGIEEDLVKKTKFIGEFQADKRQGYGELVYLNRENVRLKGFWDNGEVKPGEGIYSTEQGRVLGEVSADDIAMN